MNGRLRLALGLALVALIGCAGRKCGISGTITRAGEPLAWATEGGHLLVIFFPEDRKANKKVYRAETERDGTYRIASIPAGPYYVAIQQFDEKHNDALGHLYDPSKTTLRYEVTEDSQVLDIDLPGGEARMGPAKRPRKGGGKGK